MTHLFGRVLTQIPCVHQPEKIVGPKRRHLLKLIALGRDDIDAALPRTAGEWAELSDRAAEGEWTT